MSSPRKSLPAGFADARHWVLFGILLVPSMAVLAQNDLPAAATRPEELTPEVRQNYESLRAKLQAAEQALRRAEAEANVTYPARAIAKEYVERARAEEARTAPRVATIQAEHAAKGADPAEQFQQWLACDAQQAARERTDQMLTSERDRVLFVWYARRLLGQMSKRRAGLPPAIRNAVPDDVSDLSDPEAIEAFRNVQAKLAAAIPFDCAQVEQAVAPSKQTRELVRQASIAAFDLSIANDCASADTPEPVLAAERQIVELNNELSEVWPGWSAYEANVAKAKFHEEHPAAAHKEYLLANPPPPLQPGPDRTPWILGSLILLVAVAGLVWWTSRTATSK